MIDELGKLKFRSAFVPTDAVSLDIEMINTADIGGHLVCAAVLLFKARLVLFIFARTKLSTVQLLGQNWLWKQ